MLVKILSNLNYIIAISVGVVIVGIFIGIKLAKSKIDKDMDI